MEKMKGFFDDHVSEWARIWMSGRIEIQGNNLELVLSHHFLFLSMIVCLLHYLQSSIKTDHTQRNNNAEVKSDVGKSFFFVFLLLLDQGISYGRSCCRYFEKVSFD